MKLPILGGTDSGSTSSDAGASVTTVTSITNQSGGDQVGRGSNNNISCSTTVASQVSSSSNEATELGNTGIPNSGQGITAAREPVGSSDPVAITMSVSSAATSLSSTDMAMVVEETSPTLKSASANNLGTGTSASVVSSASLNIPVTNSLSSSTGSTAPASSSSYTDYRQIKRKLRSQVEDNIVPSIGNNSQQGIKKISSVALLNPAKPICIFYIHTISVTIAYSCIHLQHNI